MAENYEIIKKLHKGGQKTVFLANHLEFGKIVVKKGEIQSFTSLERIKREVDFLSELDSNFYPKQHYFSIDVKNKTFEIIEEYIEGNTLTELKSNYNKAEEVLTLVKSLCNALSIIWDKNIVHRDLKPDNIIIRPNGDPCIIDLGIARFLDLETLTKSISPFGPCTLIYASPEQLTNNKNLIDMRTDFFALGILALELYLKTHPFLTPNDKSNHSITENIMRGKYITKTATVEKSEVISIFAKNTLNIQPYMRFRNYKILNSFLEEQL